MIYIVIYSTMYNASIYDIYLIYNANISNLTNSDINKIFNDEIYSFMV